MMSDKGIKIIIHVLALISVLLWLAVLGVFIISISFK
jgi:hypothetical protein